VVNKAKKLRELHNLVWKYKRGFGVKKKTIKQKAKSCGVGNILAVTLAQAELNFRQADKAYRDLKPDAPALRRKWLIDRARNTSGAETEDAQQRARNAIRMEDQRDAARHMRFVLGTARAGSVSRLEHLVDGEWIEVSTQEDVERVLIMEFDGRFRLTEGTPMMVEPLLSKLTLVGVSEDARKVLDGTFVCPPEVDAFTRAYLTALTASANITSKIPSSVSREDFQNYWKKAKERTSSSISGLHFGHWKACGQDDLLSEIHALSADICLNSGHSLERWQAGLTAVLEKEKGVIRVDKMRGILLMEADYNFTNKLMYGIRMMRWAEQRQQVPQECFGSRWGHEAIELAVVRRTFLDVVRQKRVPAAISSVDAHTCYDRATHSTLSLSCQRWGVGELPLIAMLITIQQMKFFLRTAFGDSAEFYGGGISGLPFQGICQGNGGGPAMWLAMSAVLVLLLHQNGHVANIRSAISLAILTLAGLLFVDDTDLLVIAEDPDATVPSVVADMQEAVNTWWGGLQATGGDFKPPKCSWAMIAFGWDKTGQWHYLLEAAAPGEIRV
jgi:hypothetical protein